MDDWPKGSKTYFDEIHKELEEVRHELEINSGPHLEDELGDVFWDFCCLLENLEKEGKISIDNVFARSHKKYSQRIVGVEQGLIWEDIKENQKSQLEKEEKDFKENFQ